MAKSASSLGKTTAKVAKCRCNLKSTAEIIHPKLGKLIHSGEIHPHWGKVVHIGGNSSKVVKIHHLGFTVKLPAVGFIAAMYLGKV